MYIHNQIKKQKQNNDCEERWLVDHFNTIKLVITGVNKIINAKIK